ncbi:MAG TPA: hypothetical protein VE596_18295 [Gaiellaceae bacterium]|nr:hypothetical protein [Gaiellaceae bacterium]
MRKVPAVRQPLLADAEARARLARKLADVAAVSKHGDEEAWTLAHAFGDLEESFLQFLDNLLPRLLADDLTANEIESLLLDVGEEFRHILYHLADPQFYDYLRPQ